MNEQEILKALQKPFKPDEIEWRVGSTNKEKTKGIALPYITNRAIQKRLDETFGIFGWKNEFKEWKGKEQLCGISVLWGDEWVTKWDGASDSNFEGTKGGLSGAMKRAASQWGIGRYLYDIPQMWVKIKPCGKNYILDEIPKLPKWALPDNVQTNGFKWDESREDDFEIPVEVQKCINTFTNLNITKEELECYLNKEASVFDSKDIQSLRLIYAQIKSGKKTKDDFFLAIQKNINGRSESVETLEQKLSEGQ